MKTKTICIILFVLTLFYPFGAISADVTFSYKVSTGDERDYTYIISKVNGVDTESKGKKDTIKVTDMKTSTTLFGTVTTPNLEYQFWNGTTLQDQTTSFYIVKVPSNLDDATTTDYTDQYNSKFSAAGAGAITNIDIEDTNITIFIELENFQNTTVKYDLRTGWLITFHSIVYSSTDSAITVLSEILMEDRSFSQHVLSTDISSSLYTLLIFLPILGVLRKLKYPKT